MLFTPIATFLIQNEFTVMTTTNSMKLNPSPFVGVDLKIGQIVYTAVLMDVKHIQTMFGSDYLF
jgi:hypothetical protein